MKFSYKEFLDFALSSEQGQTSDRHDWHFEEFQK